MNNLKSLEKELHLIHKKHNYEKILNVSRCSFILYSR
jgi:hypothetical protein